MNILPSFNLKACKKMVSIQILLTSICPTETSKKCQDPHFQIRLINLINQINQIRLINPMKVLFILQHYSIPRTKHSTRYTVYLLNQCWIILCPKHHSFLMFVCPTPAAATKLVKVPCLLGTWKVILYLPRMNMNKLESISKLF